MSNEFHARAMADRHLVLGAITANVLALALPMATLALFDNVVATGSMPTLHALTFGLALALILEVVVRASMVEVLSRKGATFERRATSLLIRRLFDGDRDSGGEEAGVHIERAESIARLRDIRFGDAATTMLDAPCALIFVVFLWLISPVVAAVVVAMALLALGVSRLHRAGLDALQAESTARASRRYSFIVETLSNIETVKSMNLEPFMQRRYERLLRAGAAASAEETARTHAAQGAAGAVAQAAPLVVAAVGAAEVIANNLGAGAFAASILLTGRVLQPVLKLDAALAAESDARRRERAHAAIARDDAETRRRPAPPLLRSLRLQEATVRDRRGAPVLRDVDFSVERGECVAVSGPSGSGKSLLLNLMMGWTRPESGWLLVNDAPADMWDADSVRARIAFMPSQPRLIAGTVLENMTRFQPDLYGEAAMRVADELGIGRYFAQHPVGLSLPCGGGAIHGLPRSVEQRVPLVGALVAGPEAILFDEANSMLDYEGDALLLAALKRRRADVAMVIVTQRPSYLAIADRRLRIEDGRLIDAAAPAARPHVMESAP
jgi:ATP-binding cassette subfamily C protein LapB